MSHTIKLSYGGSTINLNSGSVFLREYIPQTPNLATIDTNTILTDGGERTLTTRRNVTEFCQVNVSASNASDIQAAKQKIQQWLLYAEHYQERNTGSRVYVQYAPDGTSGSLYRSELLGGKVDLESESLDYRWTRSRSVDMFLTWSRRFYWEGDTLQTLTTWNGSASDGSTCPTVYNRNDTDFDGTTGCWHNWVQIDASSINGEIPAPVMMEIKNTTSSNLGVPQFEVYHNVMGGSNIKHIYEGEDNQWINASTVTGLDAYSGSAYGKINTIGGGAYQNVFWWTVSSSDLELCGAGHYNILARFVELPTIPASTFCRPCVMYPGDNPDEIQYEAGEVEIDTTYELQNLGNVSFMSQPLDQPNELALVLQMKRSTSASVGLDFLQLSPLDSYRVVYQPGHLFGASEMNVDDNIKNIAYNAVNDTGASKTNYLQTFGQPVLLHPTRTQRLYLFIRGVTDLNLDVTSKMRLKYRPRRLTV